MTHICVGNLTIIVSDNGLSPYRRQAIIWTNAGILLIGPLGTNFSEILLEIHAFSFKKMHLKMSSGKWRPFCLGLKVLMGLLGAQHQIKRNYIWIITIETFNVMIAWQSQKYGRSLRHQWLIDWTSLFCHLWQSTVHIMQTIPSCICHIKCSW